MCVVYNVLVGGWMRAYACMHIEYVYVCYICLRGEGV